MSDESKEQFIGWIESEAGQRALDATKGGDGLCADALSMAWDAALEAAAARLEDWNAFWEANGIRERLNEFGKAIHDAQRINEQDCANAIRQLRFMPYPKDR